MARLIKKNYTAAGSYSLVVPPGVTQMFFYGTGAGGGGGAGSSGTTSTSVEPMGGGGGGGGTCYGEWVDVVPGHSLTITIGAAGTGGSPIVGGDGTPGNPGGNTSVADATAGWTKQWPGGVGGRGGKNSPGFAAGGGRNRNLGNGLNDLGETATDVNGLISVQPGWGGCGTYASGSLSHGYGRYGQHSHLCHGRANSGLGGTPGSTPAASGSYKSGGGGGGGGASEWVMPNGGTMSNTVPGFGGNGGTANSAGTGAAGSNGQTSPGGCGNGGGGAGGGGCGSVNGGLGGTGGSGGPGGLTVTWVE